MISEKDINKLSLPQILKRLLTNTKKVQIPFSVNLLARIYRYIGEQVELKEATYEITSKDANGILFSLDAVDRTITVDPDDSIGILDFVDFEKHGTGTITIQVPVGTTLNGVDNASVLINDPTAGLRLRRISYSSYTVIGNFI